MAMVLKEFHFSKGKSVQNFVPDVSKIYKLQAIDKTKIRTLPRIVLSKLANNLVTTGEISKYNNLALSIYMCRARARGLSKQRYKQFLTLPEPCHF